MASTSQLATDLGIAAMVGFACNEVARRVFPGDTISVRGSSIIGDPRWVYYLSILFQSCIFPPLGFLSWREQESLTDWFDNPWRDLHSVFWSRMSMAALWGYMVCTDCTQLLNFCSQKTCSYSQILSLWHIIFSACFLCLFVQASETLEDLDILSVDQLLWNSARFGTT